MNIEENKSLKELNTFRVDVKANRVVTIDNNYNIEELKEYLNDTHLFIGGGSNILFTKDFNGTIILIKTDGIEILNEDDKYIEVNIKAGTQWSKVVDWSLEHNLLGLHNMTDIPGSTGATPIQNVGAYGVEIKDFLISANGYDFDNEKYIKIENESCNFGYRDSIFKNELKGKYLVTDITLRLEKYTGEIPSKYTEYKGIEDKIKDISNPTPKDISNIVKQLRKEKLPSVEEYGSCGSTFKNPTISKDEYENIKKEFPELPMFDIENSDLVKIPAAHILEKLGWKNKRIGNVGTWIYHPLIVTNYGNASCEEIISFIRSMQDDFKSHTGIQLDTEINII